MIIIKKLNYNSKDIILEEKENGCIECISHCKDDCGYTRIKYNNKHERLFRVIYEMHNGVIPKNMVIRHTCDNPACCNIKHLLIGTQKDNVQDMINRNRCCRINIKTRGTKNHANKLTESQVKEIYLAKQGCKKLSRQYGVSTTSIQLIKNQKMWKWLTDSLN